MQIKNTLNSAADRYSLVVYGISGIGKTSLARTAVGKTIILSAESGLMSLSGADVDFIEIRNWPDVLEAVRLLDTDAFKEKYKNVFVDSLTETGQRLVEFLRQKYPGKDDNFNLWGEYNDLMTRFIKKMRDFKPYNVVFTALEKVDQDEMKRRFMNVDLQGKIGDRLPALFDLVLRMEKVYEKDGKSIRGFLTTSTDGAIAKDRSGKLNSPYEMADLTVVYNKIIGDKK